MSNLYSSGIRPVIDNWLAQKAAEVRDYGDYWSASSGGHCMRKVMFERLGVPYVSQDERKQRVFSSGHIFHEWAQGITKEAGISIAQELELQDEELMIRGHIDDLVLVRAPSVHLKPDLLKGTEDGTYELKQHPQVFNELDDSHLILYDYKTAHSKWFEYKRTGAISHYHKMQLGTYMYILRKYMPKIDALGNEATRGQYVNEGRILHISKDDLRMAETILFWSPELEKEVYSYWSTLNGYWKSKKLPKCTCADYENGFLAKEKYNGYFYQGEPCSLAWLTKCKAEGLLTK